MLGDEVPRGDPPASVNVIVETPLGSRVKYAAIHGLRGLQVSKVLPGTLAFPANAGFFARCAGADGDPLDAMVLASVALAPGIVCVARPVAVFRMTDRGARDDKVVCVLEQDPQWQDVTGLGGIPGHVRTAFRTFHETYRVQEGTQKEVRLQGWAGKGTAHRLLEEGYRRYDRERRP